MRGLSLSAVFFLVLANAIHAAPHRVQVYPNPSLTILSIVEGPDGLLWLATSDGVYRFDGFHYHKITAYPFISARSVAFTKDRTLWASSFEGLARVKNNRFEVPLREDIGGLVGSSDELFVRVDRSLAQVRIDGSVTRRAAQLLPRELSLDAAGRVWSICTNGKQVCIFDPQRPDWPESFPIPAGFQQVVPDANGSIWLADDAHAVQLDHGRPGISLEREGSREPVRPGPLLTGRNHQLWFLGETIRGLISKVEFHDSADHDRYPPTAGLEDSHDRLWVASLGQGLVAWVQEPTWQRWLPEEFAASSVEIVPGPKGTIILATHKYLYSQGAGSKIGEWKRLTTTEQVYEGLLPLDGGGYLASIRDFGLARLSSDGKVVEKLKDLDSREQYRELIRDSKGRIWAGNKRALLRVEGAPGSLHLREELLPGIHDEEPVDAVDLELDSSGRLWVGYAEGIAWLDDQDRWHKLATDQPVTMVRSIAVASDDIWVAYRRSGTFSRLHRNGDQWNVTQFSGVAGYTPVDTHFVKRDSRGWIWRGSPDGVHISDGQHVEPSDWIHIREGNGLAANPSAQYQFFEDTDSSVWIVGGEGVTHFRPDASWFDAPRSAPPPQVTRLEADGQKYLYPAPVPQALPSATKILRIDIGALRAPPFRDYPLRYRLLPASKAWRLSRDGALEFSNLPDKNYTLEVGYTGNGASAVGSFSFRIGDAPGILSGGAWLWLAVPLIAMGAMIPIVRYVPRFEGANFRMEKAFFLMRRRYRYRKLHSPAGLDPAIQDYSGQILAGRYRLERVLSRGGFSVVYEARDIRDERERLAVKVLNRASGQGSGKDSWIRDRFAHEVAALRSVEHHGVVRILDSWIGPAGEPGLAMPFLEGQTLRAAIEEVRFPARRTARIVRQLGAALAEIHSRGIVHRDLKPENVILRWPGTEQEQAVVIDFGTAGVKSGENELAATTLMAGSFHYMAPERLAGRYSPASDVFSLGVIILEMLTGKRLADLKSMFTDPSFPKELENTLESYRLPILLAGRLAPAFSPEPRKRPSDLGTWTEEIASALDHI